MTDLFSPAPKPSTALGRYRIMSSTAGVRVSPLQLGAMSIGEAWAEFMGSMNKEQSFKLLDAFYDAGGNFIDTANNYQNEESETWIGEWMEKRGVRDQIVLATKFTTPYRSYKDGKGGQGVNFSGNSKRSMIISLRDSLKKLKTDFVDVLYLHWWDFSTSIPEIMDSLHMLVEQGKVMYLGISDSPAWIVSAANTYAIAHGKTPFSIYQGRWNLLIRDMERDIIPMCRHFGMAVAPWDALGGGKFQSKKRLQEREAAGEKLRSMMGGEQSEDEVKMSEALAKVAEEHGIESVTTIALAWIMSKVANCYPIVGGRKVEYLHDNIKALEIELTDKQIEYLESIKPFDVGFPHDFNGQDPHVHGEAQGILAGTAPIAWLQAPKPAK